VEAVMITGAHSIIYSRDADGDRAFLRDVLGLPHVDVGGGWLVFALPPAEVAVHPSERNDVHEFYLLTDDVAALISTLSGQGVACSAPQTMSWGTITHVTLPGGGKLGIYEARHARPKQARRKAGPGTSRRSRPTARPRPGGRRRKG
jgi:hypothetical protein